MIGKGAIFRSLLAAVLIVFALVYLLAKYESGSFNILLGDHKHKRIITGGELTQGVVFRQPVDIHLIRQTGPEWAGSPLCLEIYMSNYGRRANTGTIRLGVQLDGRSETQLVAAKTVTDNTYHRICLNNITLADIYAAHELQILVEGVDSPAGSAVTVWTTQDVSRGQLNTQDERNSQAEV